VLAIVGSRCKGLGDSIDLPGDQPSYVPIIQACLQSDTAENHERVVYRDGCMDLRDWREYDFFSEFIIVWLTVDPRKEL
jgi:hypothetical protein